jgi:hypothetical protein
MQGLGDTSSFAPVPTPRLHKADGPSTGATLPAYSVVQRPYGRCSPTVPFTALGSFLTPLGVGGESSFPNFTTVPKSTPLRGVGLYPRFEKQGFSPAFFYKISVSKLGKGSGNLSSIVSSFIAITIAGDKDR